jgi:hypothetical protein
MKLFAMALGLLLFVSFGCNRSHKRRSTDSQVEVAYQLIDEGRYTEAIDLFSYLLQQEDTPTIRLGLASAYAARAGVKVHDYWDLVMPSVRAQPPKSFPSTEKFKSQWQEILLQLPPEHREALQSKAEDVFRAHHEIETLKWRFQQVPLLTRTDQSHDLLEAREIIKNLESKGSHLYRALLTLVLFRYETNQSVEKLKFAMGTKLDQTKTRTINTDNPCTSELKDWLNHFPMMLDLMAEFIVDVKVAYPNKLKQLESFEKDFHTNRGQIHMALNLVEETLCHSH